jgi:hypothetical protein
MPSRDYMMSFEWLICELATTQKCKSTHTNSKGDQLPKWTNMARVDNPMKLIYTN